jgi:hypothetical protein
MIDGAERYFEEIANCMVGEITEEWSFANLEAIFFSASIAFEAEYVRSADGKTRSFAPNVSGLRAIMHLRQKFRDAGKAVWCRVRFKLQADGKFDIDWGYDDCDANGNAIYDEEREYRRLEARRIRLIELGR